VELARRGTQPSSLALSLHFSGMLCQLMGDAAGVLACARESVELAAREGFLFWHAGGRVLMGWATAALGDAAGAVAEIRAGLVAWGETGSRTYECYYLGLLAEALCRAGENGEAVRVTEQAIALAEELGEGLYMAELWRIRAGCLIVMRDAGAAEVCFLRARAIAADQGARLFEVRAVAELARLRVGEAGVAHANEPGCAAGSPPVRVVGAVADPEGGVSRRAGIPGA
jgi:predicted ATPase